MDAPRRPNLILLVTDQQRAPQHWPDDPAWLEQLMPAEAQLRRTGLSFEQACTATSMCSPSRATFLTGAYPFRHGVTLTLTMGDLWPNPRNLPFVLRETGRLALSGEAPRERLRRQFVRSLLRRGPLGGNEPELPAGFPTLATRLRGAGYNVVYKGKWHLTKPVAGRDWSAADAERIERDFGFAGWEAPDAGENTDAEHFGGGNAGRSHGGWDEDYVRQVERFLAQAGLPEPFCLVISLVNPHDVLGYPASYEAGGYRRTQFADLGVQLPATIDEDVRGKPSVHALMKLGQIGYLGPLATAQARSDYVNFYAYLHQVVDAHIGRILAALGDASDSGSLRSRTVIARISDHGEMGLAHGGLRQKMFNVYEETIRVPMVVSNPVLFGAGSGAGAETSAPASLVDIVPTLLGLAGAPATGALDGRSLCGVLAHHARPDAAALSASGVDWAGVTEAEAEVSARDHVLFTYDDHQAGTALQEVAGQPNRIRCVRDGRWKYAVYFDPTGRAATEFELYDLDADPLERFNLLAKRGGDPHTPAAGRELPRLRELLEHACAEVGAAASAR
jgi:arylsulfatase A-like enzyme